METTQRNSTYLLEPRAEIYKIVFKCERPFLPNSEVVDLWFEEVLNEHESYSFTPPAENKVARLSVIIYHQVTHRFPHYGSLNIYTVQ